MAEKIVWVELAEPVLYRPEGEKDARTYGPGRTQVPLALAVHEGLVEEQEDGSVKHTQSFEDETDGTEEVPVAKEGIEGGRLEEKEVRKTVKQAFGQNIGSILRDQGYEYADELSQRDQKELEGLDGIGSTYARRIRKFFEEG